MRGEGGSGSGAGDRPPSRSGLSFGASGESRSASEACQESRLLAQAFLFCSAPCPSSPSAASSIGPRRRPAPARRGGSLCTGAGGPPACRPAEAKSGGGARRARAKLGSESATLAEVEGFLGKVCRREARSGPPAAGAPRASAHLASAQLAGSLRSCPPPPPCPSASRPLRLPGDPSASSPHLQHTVAKSGSAGRAGRAGGGKGR